MTQFKGLSAFSLTPASREGVVDVDALGILVDRLARAGVDAIGLLGSTGIYAYLDRGERRRALAAAIEAVAGRVPLLVGVGALRTSWVRELAGDAERAGATGLLLAPTSYLPLTDDEVLRLYREVAGSTGLPLCIYSNPSTTNFVFTEALIAELAAEPRVKAVKMPLPERGDFSGQLDRLRATVPTTFSVGYSGDWGCAASLLAGGDAWYSVVAGLLPEPALRLTRAAQAGNAQEVVRIDAALGPLWALFRAHGSLRVMYSVADRLGLRVGDPPAPVRRIGSEAIACVHAALDQLAG